MLAPSAVRNRPTSASLAALAVLVAASGLAFADGPDDGVEGAAPPAPAPAPAADDAEAASPTPAASSTPTDTGPAVELERSFRIKAKGATRAVAGAEAGSGGGAGGAGTGLAVAPRGITHAPAVVFTRDGKMLVTATSDGAVVAWDADTREERRRLEVVTDGSISTMAIDRDGEHLVVCRDGGGIKSVDLETGETIAEIEKIATKAVAVAPDGASIAMAVGNAVEIRAVPGLELQRTLEGHEAAVTDVEWSPDGKLVVSAGQDGRVRVLDAAGEVVRELKRGQPVYAVAFAPDGKRFAYGGHERLVTQVEIASGEETLISGADRQPYWITSLGYSPDGSEIAVGDESCDVWLHEVEARKLLFHGKHHVECWLEAPAWSPDGEQFVFGCRPNTHSGVPAVWAGNDIAEAQLAKGYRDNGVVLRQLRERLIDQARAPENAVMNGQLLALLERREALLGNGGEDGRKAAQARLDALVAAAAEDWLPAGARQGIQVFALNDVQGQLDQTIPQNGDLGGPQLDLGAMNGFSNGLSGLGAPAAPAPGALDASNLAQDAELRGAALAGTPEKQAELEKLHEAIDALKKNLLEKPDLIEIVDQAQHAQGLQKDAFEAELSDVQGGFNVNCWKRKK